DPDLDLERRIAAGLLGGSVAQVGGNLTVADDAERRNAAADLLAEQRVSWPAGSAPDQVVQRDLDCGLGGLVAVHAAVHRRRPAGDILGLSALAVQRDIRTPC